MGFFFRKRFRLCKGIDLNLSKSGVGVSVGFKGFRISRNSKGHTSLNCGRNGLYYRKRLDNKPKGAGDDVEIDKATVVAALLITICAFVGTFFCAYCLNYGIIKSLFYTFAWIFVAPFYITIGVILYAIISSDLENNKTDNNESNSSKNENNRRCIYISTILMVISTICTYLACYYLNITYLKSLLYSVFSGIGLVIIAFIIMCIKPFFCDYEDENKTNS